MRGVRELVEGSYPRDSVRLAQLLQVPRQCLWVTRDVNNPLKLGRQLTAGRVEPGARRVDQQGVKPAEGWDEGEGGSAAY